MIRFKCADKLGLAYMDVFFVWGRVDRRKVYLKGDARNQSQRFILIFKLIVLILMLF